MRKNTLVPTLLCILLLAVCLLGLVGCEPAKVECHHFNLTEHPATPADCTHEGNDLWYSCDDCDVILDAEKNIIETIPTLSTLGHDYEEHALVPATCTEDGNALYYTCRREDCNMIFNAEKNVIENIPVIAADGHAWAWKTAEDGKTATLTCAACNATRTTIRLSLDETARFLADYDERDTAVARYDLSGYGEGVTAVAVRYGSVTLTDVTVTDGILTFRVADLLSGAAMGKFDITITLAVTGAEKATVDVKAPITYAKVIDSIDDLLAIRPVLTNGTATVTGGTVEETEIDGKTKTVVTSREYYVLVADISGLDKLGGVTVYGADVIDEGDTSGSAKAGFVGILDGQGHTVSHFSMTCRGFLGHIGQATVRDITFSDISLDASTATVLGKSMDTTFENVTIRNITPTTARDTNAGIVFYHQAYSVDINGMTVDLSGVDFTGHIFARFLTDDDGSFGPCSLQNVKVKAAYSTAVDLFDGMALTAAKEGITVAFDPFTIGKPAADETTYYYTGHEISYIIPDSLFYTVEGNKQTEVGTYTVTVTLKPYEGLSWEDGTADPVTYTFTIVEMTDDAAAAQAAAFEAKVTALGETPVFPLFKTEVDKLAAEYEVLHDKVKELLAGTKTKLDALKAVSDQYAELEATFDSVKLITALGGYETYYLVIYNPNDTEGYFYVADGRSWANVASATLEPQAWTQIELPYDSAVKGDNYTYYAGASVGLTSGDWKVLVYGYTADPNGIMYAVNSFVDAVDNLPVGSLGVDDGETVARLRTGYDALSGYAKSLVPAATLDRLVAAEAEMVTVRDRAAADAVKALVDALTDESAAEEVVAAKNAYDALTDAQKAYITEETLTKLNAQVARAEEAVVAAKVAEFKAKVDALGETPVLPLMKQEIENLVTEYETLDKKVKERLADTKEKLDAFAVSAARYVRLEANFASDHILSTFSGYDSYYLVICNPTAADVSFYYSGNASGWAAVGATTLAAAGKTQISYDIRFATAGNAYLYGNGATIDFTGNSEAWAGWTCEVYGYTPEPGTLRTVLSVGGTVDDSTYGKVLSNNVSGGYMDKWGTMSKEQLEALSAFENVHFYVYNPSDVDVWFFFQDDSAWAGHDRTLCKAKSWTKISLSEVFSLPEAATLVYVDVDKNTEGIVLDGWLITDFFGY